MKTHKTNGEPTQKYMRRLLVEQRRARCSEELAAWLECRSAQPTDISQWTVQDAKACADRIRAIDEILHRNGFCSRDRNCLSCDAMVGAE